MQAALCQGRRNAMSSALEPRLRQRRIGCRSASRSSAPPSGCVAASLPQRPCRSPCRRRRALRRGPRSPPPSWIPARDGPTLICVAAPPGEQRERHDGHGAPLMRPSYCFSNIKWCRKARPLSVPSTVTVKVPPSEDTTPRAFSTILPFCFHVSSNVLPRIFEVAVTFSIP